MSVDSILRTLTHEREALTLELRSLATDLDGIDREMTDRSWRHKHDSGTPLTDLEAEHARLTAQLRQSAVRLRDLDQQLARARAASAVT